MGTLTKSTGEILGDAPARDVLLEIFADLHPGLIDENRSITSIFNPQSAREFLVQLSDVTSLLSEEDSFEDTLAKLQVQINQAEETRDQLLDQVFAQLRPIERSYRELQTFFDNTKVYDGKQRKPVELFIWNADPREMKDVYSMTVAAVENFCKKRNDNFNFRDDICNLVIPGWTNQLVRERLESIANQWGILLITDIDDEKSFQNVERNFRPGGKYEFLKRPEDRAAADVVVMGYLQLRPKHWFEKIENGDDLYGPPSLAFAGAVARTDDSAGMAQGPVGSRFGQVNGPAKARIEPLISEMEHISMERQLIPVIRDADNKLCFFGCRTLADDPYGVYKFFTSYRIIRYIERCCRHYLLQVAGQALTREFMDEAIEKPIARMLQEQVEAGTLLDYKLEIDRDANKRMQGICDVKLEIMPAGPGESFRLKIDTPEFASEGAKQ
jgi:Type VI secretion system, TssC, VipB